MRRTWRCKIFAIVRISRLLCAAMSQGRKEEIQIGTIVRQQECPIE